MAQGGSGPGAAQQGPYFPPAAVWTQDITMLPKDPESDAVIPWLDDQGFGTGEMRIDFTIEVLEAGADVPFLAFDANGDFFDPDCDLVPMPVPADGALEGEDGYECTNDGDCHLIVVHQSTRTLYEMWRANIQGSAFSGGCLAVWDLTRVYGPTGRGAQCTSADAAGYPIAPLLFTADEIQSGAINHAIRFILPNERIRAGAYVHPATHAGAPSGPDSAPPYGARLRLRVEYPLESLPNEAARIVARAMQTYGMVLADGGQITLTAQSDRFTAAKWDDVGLDAGSLSMLTPADFEMVEAGERIPITNDCEREPLN